VAASDGGESARRDGGAGTTVRAGPTLRCATCDSPVDRTEWHPVATRFDEERGFALYAFCRAACRREWRDG
jgi:hypothetical protein